MHMIPAQVATAFAVMPLLVRIKDRNEHEEACYRQALQTCRLYMAGEHHVETHENYANYVNQLQAFTVPPIPR